MERSKAILPAVALRGSVIVHSLRQSLSSLLSQQVEMGVQNMLKRTSEIDQSAADIGEDIEQSASEKINSGG